MIMGICGFVRSTLLKVFTKNNLNIEISGMDNFLYWEVVYNEIKLDLTLILWYICANNKPFKLVQRDQKRSKNEEFLHI